MAALRKQADDDRPWDFHRDFVPRSRLERLLRRNN
jgi:hypothetical protein